MYKTSRNINPSKTLVINPLTGKRTITDTSVNVVEKANKAILACMQTAEKIWA